jgi:hypothetical protein
MTKILLKYLSPEDFESNFIDKNDKKIQNEIKKMNRVKNEQYAIFQSNKIFFGYMYDKFKNIKKEFIIKETCFITKSEILHNPFISFFIFGLDKNWKRNSLSVVSLMINISLIFFTVINNASTVIIMNREDYYNNYILNNLPFYVTITLIFSNIVYYFLLKYCGINLLLSISFFMTFIYSLMFTLSNLSIREPEDMNKNYFNDLDIIMKSSRNYFIWYLFSLIFFSYGQMLALYFLLIKYTKTMYRCSFLGFCYVIIYSLMLICWAYCEFYERSMAIVCGASITGFLNSIFIDGDMGFNIVKDFRKIQIDSTT